MGIVWLILAVAAFFGFMSYCEHIENVNRHERSIRSGRNLDYAVKYNNKNRKYFIEIVSNSGRCCVTNRFRLVQYYKSSNVARVEMEKLKGNFI